jgi:hypothetical protein
MDEPQNRDVGSSLAVLREIQERSEDFIEVVIPLCEAIHIHGRGDYPGEDVLDIGMVLKYSNGTTTMIHRADAQLILNYGILNRMRIPIRLSGVGEDI